MTGGDREMMRDTDAEEERAMNRGEIRDGTKTAEPARGVLCEPRLLLWSRPAPAPVPTVAPAVTSRAFVHALDPTQLVLTTFEVVPETGLLKPQGSVPVKAESLGQIDADPKGRFVYVGGVVGFAVNATNGTLSQVSSFGGREWALAAGRGEALRPRQHRPTSGRSPWARTGA